MSVEQLIDDLETELAALWGAGVGLPGPERPRLLQALADRFAQLGLSWPTSRLRALATALEEDAAEAYATTQELASWARAFREGWSLELAREHLSAAEGDGAGPRRPSGVSATVAPLGLERAGNRLTLHVIDEQGAPLALLDEVTGLSRTDPLGQPVASRLFQDRVRYGRVLTSRIRLEDHPVTRTGGRVVLRPSFYARPTLVAADRRARDRLPQDRLRRGAAVRQELVLRRTGEGWRFEHEGGDVTIAGSDLLDFNLAKRFAVDRGELDAVVLGRSEGATLLECLDTIGDPCFPTVDPSAVRWAPRRVVAAAGPSPALAYALAALGLAERPPKRPSVRAGWPTLFDWLAGRAPPLVTYEGEDPTAGHFALWTHLVADRPPPERLVARFGRTPLGARPTLEEVAARGLCLGGAGGRALVEAHASQLRRGVEVSEVLPDPWSLWALADAVARLRELDPTDAPLVCLDLPVELIWTTAVEVLAPWVAGGGGDEEEVASALGLLRISGEDPRFWVSPR